MERTFFTILVPNQPPHNTEDVEEVRDALRRGNDVLEVEEFKAECKGVITQTTVTVQINPNEFVF